MITLALSNPGVCSNHFKSYFCYPLPLSSPFYSPLSPSLSPCSLSHQPDQAALLIPLILSFPSSQTPEDPAPAANRPSARFAPFLFFFLFFFIIIILLPSFGSLVLLPLCRSPGNHWERVENGKRQNAAHKEASYPHKYKRVYLRSFDEESHSRPEQSTTQHKFGPPAYQARTTPRCFIIAALDGIDTARSELRILSPFLSETSIAAQRLLVP